MLGYIIATLVVVIVSILHELIWRRFHTLFKTSIATQLTSNLLYKSYAFY